MLPGAWNRLTARFSSRDPLPLPVMLESVAGSLLKQCAPLLRRVVRSPTQANSTDAVRSNHSVLSCPVPAVRRCTSDAAQGRRIRFALCRVLAGRAQSNDRRQSTAIDEKKSCRNFMQQLQPGMPWPCPGVCPGRYPVSRPGNTTLRNPCQTSMLTHWAPRHGHNSLRMRCSCLAESSRRACRLHCRTRGRAAGTSDRPC